MAQVIHFVQPDNAFDPETLDLLAAVYDKAIADLNGRAELEVVREIVAKRIFNLAEKGERDPNRLHDAALIALRPAV